MYISINNGNQLVAIDSERGQAEVKRLKDISTKAKAAAEREAKAKAEAAKKAKVAAAKATLKEAEGK